MTVKPDWVVRFNNGELNSKFDQIWSGLSNLECSNIIIQPQPVKKKKIEIESKYDNFIPINEEQITF